MKHLVAYDTMPLSVIRNFAQKYHEEVITYKATCLTKHSEKKYGLEITIGDHIYDALNPDDSIDTIIDDIAFYKKEYSGREKTEREKAVLKYVSPHMNNTYVSEDALLSRIKEFLGMLEDCIIVREASAVKNGTSDLIICYNGTFIACELKKYHGVATPQQLQFIKEVKAAGGLAGVCKSVKDVWNLLYLTTSNP